MNRQSLPARLVKHIRPRVFRMVVFRKDLAEPFPQVPNPSGARIERYDYSDLQAFCEQLRDAGARTFLLHGRSQGQVCYLAWVDDRPVGMTFICTGDLCFRGRRVATLSADERHSCNSLVLAGYRGRKIFHQLKMFSYRDQAAAGVRRIYDWVATDNAASIKTHLNLGCVPLFRFTAVAWMLMNFVGPRRPVGDVLGGGGPVGPGG
jgi:hypothetical protein